MLNYSCSLSICLYYSTLIFLFIETKNELSTQVPSILKLNWKPDIKARNLVNLLKEKENNIVYTWLERVAHCKTLEDSTSDTVLCKEIIAVSSIYDIQTGFNVHFFGCDLE